MAKFSYKRRPPGTLKEATERLVVACGGIKRAAARARVGTTAIFAYTDDGPDNAARFIPADIVAELERLAGEPIVTAWLAAESGHMLLPVAVEPSGAWSTEVAELSREIAEFFEALHRALGPESCTPGRVDRREAGRVLDELRDIYPKLGRIDAHLAAVRDGEIEE